MSASLNHVFCIRLKSFLRVQSLIKKNAGLGTNLSNRIRSCTVLNSKDFTTSRHDLHKTDLEYEKEKKENEENDFFGIDTLEKNVETVENKSLEKDEIYRKYEFCNDNKSEVFDEIHYFNKPKLIALPFGEVRIDKPRTASKRKQSIKTEENEQKSIEKNSEQNRSVTLKNQELSKSIQESEILNSQEFSVTESFDFIENQYFGDHTKDNNTLVTEDIIMSDESSTQNSEHVTEIQGDGHTADNTGKADAFNFIDQQYFQDTEFNPVKSSQLSFEHETVETILTSKGLKIHKSEKLPKDGNVIDEDVNFIDQQYFQEAAVFGSVKDNDTTAGSKKLKKQSNRSSSVDSNLKHEESNLCNSSDFTESQLRDELKENNPSVTEHRSESLKESNYSSSSVDPDFFTEQIQNVNLETIKKTKPNSEEKKIVKLTTSHIGKEKNTESLLKPKFKLQDVELTKGITGVQSEDILKAVLEEESQTSSEHQHHSVLRKMPLKKQDDKKKTTEEKSKGVEKTNQENPSLKKQDDKKKTTEEKFKGGEIKDKENPKSAFAIAMKIRKEKSITDGKLQAPRLINGKLVDSKGYRILKDQVQDLSKLTREEITDILYENVIYNRDDIIAINKPYGLASQGGTDVHLSVTHLLKPLAKKIDTDLETLHIVHRLDQETTGVMLLAKTPQIASLLKSAFKNREVQKVYWTIVRGVPNPKEGRIVIPMVEGSVDGKRRMVLRPDTAENEDVKLVMKKSSIETHEAITNYKILKSKNTTALLECRPETGVKHQIRVHLAWGLGTPILGDHKYTYINKIVPQKLTSEMLQRLGIRQSKARYVPMHLHAKSILIPEFMNGQNLSVSCRLPPHFEENMKRLKLKP